MPRTQSSTRIPGVLVLDMVLGLFSVALLCSAIMLIFAPFGYKLIAGLLAVIVGLGFRAVWRDRRQLIEEG